MAGRQRHGPDDSLLVVVLLDAGRHGPADADSVLSIGSVDRNKIKSGFSSIGPTADGRIKPDLSAMGSSSAVSAVNSLNNTQLFTASGTSFSGPIFAGFAACFWQMNPNLKVMELHAELKKLGNQADKPDNLLGWGVPEFGKVVILGEEQLLEAKIQILPNPVTDYFKILIQESDKNRTFSVSIKDITGKNIYFGKGHKSGENINFANFPQGIYIGELQLATKTIPFKFLKN